jgi:L-lysine 2,3-aminomutase
MSLNLWQVAFNFTVLLCEMWQMDSGMALLQVRYNMIVLLLLVWPPSLYCVLCYRKHRCMHAYCTCVFTAANWLIALENTVSK